jgi:dihydrolipoamide dehydrogenase
MSDSTNQRIAVLGGGPGGYAAAFKAADLGLDVTLIDKEANPGGVCLYRGCIPSKALLHVAKLIEETREAAHWGVSFGEPEIDLDKLRSFKEGVVKKLTGGLGQLTKMRKITYVRGTGTFVNSTTISVTKDDGSTEEMSFDKTIVAVGSHPTKIPIFEIGSDRVMDSTAGLELEEVPDSLMILGGGYIGLEMGCVYSALGSKVTVVEMTDGLLPGADRDLAKVLQGTLSDRFEDIMLSTRVESLEDLGGAVKVTVTNPKGETEVKEFSRVLISIGRTPNGDKIGLENTDVKVERGFIEADHQMRTADPAIFAIGDVIGQPMLAHKASHEGIVAAEVIAGHKAAFEPACIPAVVFTDPELAWVGITEAEAKANGQDVVVTKFPWAASGRATTLDRKDGLTKLIVDRATNRILGVGIVGPGAGEMIAEGALAVEMAATADDLKLTIHPHPTLSETVMETAEMIYGPSTHVYAKKR